MEFVCRESNHIVDALRDFMKITDAKERGVFLKAFDKMTAIFKSYAILTPGFHVRNYIGGAFNNWYSNNLANNPGGTGWYVGNNPGVG